jgi:hypothetical protein
MFLIDYRSAPIPDGIPQSAAYDLWAISWLTTPSWSDDFARSVLDKCITYWEVAESLIAEHEGTTVNMNDYFADRLVALRQEWPEHLIDSSGVHYNRLGNKLIAGAVILYLDIYHDMDKC